MEIVRWAAGIVLLSFTAYTVHCGRRESFWRSLKTVMGLRWGRQVTADLYIGLCLFLFLIYLNEASLWKTALWLVPTLIFGNLTTLAYVVVHFDSLLSHFR